MKDDLAWIPVVDVAPLYLTDPERRAAVDQAIGVACETAGAFIAKGIPQPVLPDEQQTKKLLAFYNLSRQQRDSVGTRRVNSASQHDYRGYSARESNAWTQNEIYDIGPEYQVTVPDLPKAPQLVETNQWPQDEPEAGWKEAMESYFTHMHDFSKRLISSMIRYLGANELAGAARFEKSNSTLRLLNYPPMPDGVDLDDNPDLIREFDGEKMRIMAVEHCDQCCLTLLWQSDVGGLQMQSPQGEWQAIPPIKDGISVHLGMAMGPMTEYVFSATPHRVLGRGNGRQSIGFFLEPHLYASTKPFSKEAVEAPVNAEETYAAALLRTFAEREARANAKQ